MLGGWLPLNDSAKMRGVAGGWFGEPNAGRADLRAGSSSASCAFTSCDSLLVMCTTNAHVSACAGPSFAWMYVKSEFALPFPLVPAGRGRMSHSNGLFWRWPGVECGVISHIPTWPLGIPAVSPSEGMGATRCFQSASLHHCSVAFASGESSVHFVRASFSTRAPLAYRNDSM